MPILAIFVPLVNWIFRGVIIKFVVLAGVFGFMAVVLPVAVDFVLPFIGVTQLTNAFGGLDAGVWFWLDFFALDYGVPLLISAHVARFLIRRLPVIG